jgi:DNA-directed RNA polymerase III subunit RPC2
MRCKRYLCISCVVRDHKALTIGRSVPPCLHGVNDHHHLITTMEDFMPPLPSSHPSSSASLSSSAMATTRRISPWGNVRATPLGSRLDSNSTQTDAKAAAVAWHEWRSRNLEPIAYPLEGFDHVHGQNVIDEIDGNPLGSLSANAFSTSTTHDYGSEKTPDDAPVHSLREKWRLLPHFLRLRSLLRQHIDSFDHFVEVEMKEIVSSPSACEIRSDHDPKFYLRYEACWVGEPSIEEESYSVQKATPFHCRLRDCTYSAPIYVNVRYTRGRQIVVKRNVIVGRLPIMLRSKNCVLRDKNEHEQMALHECPYDPGAYFLIKGVEKVILIQEQLSKNRVILEQDAKGSVCASITSSTHERKSKSYILVKHGRVYLKNNTLGEDIPIVIVLKAMGVESDLEMVQLVASHQAMLVNAMALSLEEASRFGIRNQHDALLFIGTKIRGRSVSGASSQPPSQPPANSTATGTTATTSFRKPLSPEDEAREVLAFVVLSHVPVEHYNFRTKAIFIGHIVRRVLLVHLGQMPLDDKDYYGNKRLELAGDLLSLLFEDLFKIFNKDLKRQADLVLSKPNRAQAFDIVKCIRPDTISNGMVNAIATGNWVLKRFRMDRAGVTQVLSRLSYMSALGMMTRINSQFEKTRKVSGPRSLQASQWGMLCPADTPEGEACGLVKNLALLAHITTDETDTKAIERLCRDLGVEDVRRMTGHEIHSSGAYLVFLNGLVMGVHTRPVELVRNIRHMRRQGLAGEFLSVYLHEGQRAVHIATDGGRVCRPLIIVDEQTGVPTLKQKHLEALASGVITVRDLLRQGVIEYVDCNEENNTLIALTERELEIAIQQGLGNRKMGYTHLEVDPLTILGVIGGIIPVRSRVISSIVCGHLHFVAAI